MLASWVRLSFITCSYSSFSLCTYFLFYFFYESNANYLLGEVFFPFIRFVAPGELEVETQHLLLANQNSDNYLDLGGGRVSGGAGGANPD